MNVIGTIMWLSVGGIALHYWAGYMPDHDFVTIISERAVSKFLFLFNPPSTLFSYANPIFSSVASEKIKGLNLTQLAVTTTNSSTKTR